MVAAFIGIVIIGSGTWFWKNTKTEPAQVLQNENDSEVVIQGNSDVPKEPEEIAKPEPAKKIKEEKKEQARAPQKKQDPKQGVSKPAIQKNEQIQTQKPAYTDGTYSAIGNYTSPAGAEEVDVSLTLKNAIITNAEFVGKATHPASKKWQDTFSTGYKEKIIEKSIKELSLVAVSGASLATKGFMDAVEKIKQQAGK